MLSLPPTPNSNLLKEIRGEIKYIDLPGGSKILLNGANGKRLEQVINNAANPWTEIKCGRVDCFVCNSKRNFKEKSVLLGG